MSGATNVMETKTELFEFEQANQWRFNQLYQKHDIPYKRISGEDNKKYDCVILWEGEWIKIEEKYRSSDFNDLLVELIQDTETNDPGWIVYSEADYLIYGVSQKFFIVDLPRLREFVKKHGSKFNQIVSEKGWGRTVNIAIPLYTIFDNKLGKKIT